MEAKNERTNRFDFSDSNQKPLVEKVKVKRKTFGRMLAGSLANDIKDRYNSAKHR